MFAFLVGFWCCKTTWKFCLNSVFVSMLVFHACLCYCKMTWKFHLNGVFVSMLAFRACLCYCKTTWIFHLNCVFVSMLAFLCACVVKQHGHFILIEFLFPWLLFLQVSAKHACTLHMWLCLKWHGAWLCGVDRMCRYSSSFMWHQPCQHHKCTTSVEIKKCTVKS